MSKVIQIEKVTKTFPSGDGKVHAIKDITFSLDEAESMAIVGPSGSGKSTLLNIIGGLEKPNAGKVHINGQSMSELTDNQLSKFRNMSIGFIFQFFNLQDYSNALENVALPLILSGAREKIAKKRATELLTKMGLEHRIKHYPRQLSGGEMQRVAIARSLANNPKILLADEPTANLDKESAENVLNLFDDIAKSGVSVVVITHDPEVSKKFKNILRLKNGQIV